MDATDTGDRGELIYLVSPLLALGKLGPWKGPNAMYGTDDVVLHPHRPAFLALGMGMLVVGLPLSVLANGSPGPLLVMEGAFFTVVGMRVLLTAQEGLLRMRFLFRTRAIPAHEIRAVYPGRRLGGWGLCIQTVDGRLIEPWVGLSIDLMGVQVTTNKLSRALGLPASPGFLGRMN